MEKEVINIEPKLKKAHLEEFLDFCILCGTDYNSNIQGVGSVSSFRLIKEHSSLESISENTQYDTSCLNYHRVRELFTEFNSNDIKTDVPYCGEPDFEVLRNFLNSISLRMNLEYLRKCFIREIIIMDDNSEEVVESKED